MSISIRKHHPQSSSNGAGAWLEGGEGSMALASYPTAGCLPVKVLSVTVNSISLEIARAFSAVRSISVQSEGLTWVSIKALAFAREGTSFSID